MIAATADGFLFQIFVSWVKNAYFTGYDPEHGTELWVSNGTMNGTRLFKDINPKISSAPENLTSTGKTAFFHR